MLTAEETAAVHAQPMRLAVCWLVSDAAGNVSRYTNHDAPIAIDKSGLEGIYQSLPPIEGGEVSGSADLAVDNLEVRTPLDVEGVTQAMIRAGMFDNVRFVIFLADWSAPHNTGIVVKRGVIGNVRIESEVAAVFELRSIKQFLQQQVVSLVSRSCRARLGQTTAPYKCLVDLGTYTETGSVDAVSSRRSFTATGVGILDKDPEWFRYGLLTFTSGSNAGFSMEVKANAIAGQFELLEPMPFAIEPADAFSVYAGCDKMRETCISKFGNVLNFQGEPDAPSISDLIAGTPA